MTTQTQTSPGKQIITAAEFLKRKKDFVRDRMEQYHQRTAQAWHIIADVVLKPNSVNQIDAVVDAEYHSSNMPSDQTFIII